ncbi:single-pass membrane and coiled-coil domain-containing protein 3-like [Triplophysa rosa]|uniref:single-pass membrane and coiled-coil domain-containing protein 3-like n=1 Tax=Triplophysa rosa TaxID=992332 RepID=UPI002545D1F9|nr:single-pass membrane and coiled-coil domain-containing protein 3-like [Triplophysa rosa]
MSMSDIFFPGNPERREKVIRKSQELLELMQDNFDATNELIDILSKHLQLSFRKISLKKSATIKVNCDVLIERIHEIQAAVEKINKKLKEELEPALYEELRNMNLSVCVNKYRTISAVLRGVCSLAAIGSIAVVGWLIYNGTILTSIQMVCGVIGTQLLAGFVIGLAFIGIDAIFSYFIGSAERDRLEKAIEEYDRALKDFRPASKIYQRSITRVIIRIEDIERQ